MRFFHLGILTAALVALSVVGASGCTSSSTPAGDVPLGDTCTDDSQCVSGAACDAKTGICVPANGHPNTPLGTSCVYDAECDSGDFCSDDGICVPDPYGGQGAQGMDDPCFTDADCLSGTCDIHTDSCD